PAALASPLPPSLPAPRARRGSGVGPWVTGGVGVAALAFAGASYGVALDARSGRDALCFPAGCHAEAADLDARYIDWLAATNVGLVAGGTLLASALVWYVAARIAGRPEAAPRPVVTANRIGVDLAF
ncbi:MAG: hypothetical protein Q8S73_40255, partial [Deltaproteobacteria bacterium]|nr:hypothetical protein [Deltaproteobacteria bacterium]